MIPPKVSEVQPKERRFYVLASSATYFELQREAFQRDTDIWTLCGSVLTAWLSAGCPDFKDSAITEDLNLDSFPIPSPSSVAARD